MPLVRLELRVPELPQLELQRRLELQLVEPELESVPLGPAWALLRLQEPAQAQQLLLVQLVRALALAQEPV
ncbi:hypothetical protein GCM10011375_05820 [Hymenobacter qilianensis]|uniref:Uncharacterized protein n=1 Tax=Hymenobacter qilianensis TaxID=1385715 RepID=A0ACB5PMG7_9BACT|nr:hypothetical protein GCM10011375_05820 [Hymenobacter qilianensis]